eukprot:COSAG06_NODE_7059_length_2652_cov_3.164904_1_plen_22_part_10
MLIDTGCGRIERDFEGAAEPLI